MPEQKNRQEWFFKWITPLQAMRLCVVIVIVCMCVALGSAVAWCFSRLNNSAVTYDYKYVSPQEYLQQNGSTVLSYDEEKNQIAFMMNEDLINTVLNAYLQSQNYMLGDYKIYEMVYRQKEGKFYFQLKQDPDPLTCQCGGDIGPRQSADCAGILQCPSGPGGQPVGQLDG